MHKPIYIPENRARELIESYVNANKASKGFIQDTVGFPNHEINVGTIVYNSASKAIQKNHSLEAELIPDALRVCGYMHDFGKIEFGDPFHEIHVAHLISTRGDKDELGLVTGGTKKERKEILKYIASLLGSDVACYEELGGDNFPEGNLLPQYIKPDYLPQGDRGVVEKVNHLRRELSPYGRPLTMKEFALPDYDPNKLARKFIIHADLNDERPFEERLAEVQERFRGMKDGRFGDYFVCMADLIDQTKPRLKAAVNEVKLLIN